jgi:hypothetical protein
VHTLEIRGEVVAGLHLQQGDAEFVGHVQWLQESVGCALGAPRVDGAPRAHPT